MYYFLILLFLLTAPLMAQTGATSGEASPSPTVSVTPATDATPPPLAEPTPAASPSPQADGETATPPVAKPSASPANGEDIIPLPPESGPSETPIVSETEVPKLSKPSSGESLPDAAFADPNAVIPTDTSSLPPTPSGPSAQEIERKLKVRYQEVRVQVEKDPAVRSLMEQSKSAKSFEDERAALREYYRLLFKKMKKADKDLTVRCDRLEQAYLARLAQTRVEPTIPLNPPPTPAPLSE
ncbi:MAG: hypothetical protein ACOYM3_25625 [Terrimicrobiaceae bacterium]